MIERSNTPSALAYRATGVGGRDVPVEELFQADALEKVIDHRQWS